MLLRSSWRLSLIINCFMTGICKYYHLNINEHHIELLMDACGINICYIVVSEKPSCLAMVAAACNVSGLASVNLTIVAKHVYMYSETSSYRQKVVDGLLIF